MANSETDLPRTAVRVRFAPSPTGALHIGGARTAYFNWLFARQQGGTFVLRIDDTDRARSTEASFQQILACFRWLELDFDEGPGIGGPCGPYRQSERQPIYEAALQQLQASGRVYPCFCSAEQLASDREAQQRMGNTPRYAGRCRQLSAEERRARIARGDAHTWRLHAERDEPVVVRDVIRGEVVFAPEEIDDFIVWKADGTPTYHFASCVDDARMEITHIIRADEHLSNTPRHIVLFEALNHPLPVFAHVPMILAPDRSKLSKRHGATSVDEYRDAGILPEALVNYLLLLGFSPGDEHEVLSREEAVQRFTLDRVSKHAAIYDVKKLEWLNGQYLRSASPDALLALIWGRLVSEGWVAEQESRERLAWMRTLVALGQTRSHRVSDLADGMRYYFVEPTAYDAKGVQKHFSAKDAASRLTRAADRLADVKPFVIGEIEALYRSLIAEWQIKPGELIHPTRLALSGVTAGPGLFDMMCLLGLEACQTRLRQAAAAIVRGEVPLAQTPVSPG